MTAANYGKPKGETLITTDTGAVSSKVQKCVPANLSGDGLPGP